VNIDVATPGVALSLSVAPAARITFKPVDIEVGFVPESAIDPVAMRVGELAVTSVPPDGNPTETTEPSSIGILAIFAIV
jgi:hypothetical protein